MKMVASAVAASLLNRHRLREEVRNVLAGKSENGQLSLEEILGNIPPKTCMYLNLLLQSCLTAI